MLRNSRVVSFAFLASTALSTVAISGQAFAADAEVAEAPAATPEPAGTDIIVTGTRATGQAAAKSATPIQLLSQEALSHVSTPNLNQALTQLVPSFQAQNQGTDMASFSLSARLRGVSPNHTLVQVNGKRRHGNSILQVINGAFVGSAAPSIDLIPPSMVSRIEILQDGAAAQYGSDAIAGVINIILKSQTSGGSFKADIGQYYDGEGRTHSLSGNIGMPLGDTGFLDISLFHRKNEVTTLGTGQTSVTNIDGTPNTLATGAGAVPTLFAPIYANLTNTGALSHITGGQPRSQLDVAFFNAGYDFGGVEVYAFGDVSYRDGEANQGYRNPKTICPVVTSATALALNPASCYQPTVAAGMVPIIEVVQNEYSFTTGFKGTVGGWNWDLSGTYADDKARIYTTNSANLSLFRATGFTPRSFYDGSFEFNQFTTTLDMKKEFNIGLSDPLTVAWGAELRKETYRLTAGDAASTYVEGGQSFAGYNAGDAGFYKRTAKAIYGDVVIKPVEKLLIEVAGRFENYSDFGNTTIGKLTARYDFSPEIALRGTISTGFRAPSLQESGYSATNVGPTSASVQLAPSSAAATASGFGALKPEKSFNLSAGFVFRPVPRLIVTLDGYYIKIRDRIVSSGTIVGQRVNAVSGAAAVPQLTPVINGVTAYDLVSRAIAVSGKTLDPNVVQFGQLGIQVFTNGIDTRTQGLELSARYPVDTSFGKIDFSLGLNYNETKVTNNKLGALLNAQAQAIIEQASPKLKTVLNALFSSGKFTANVRGTYYSATTSLVSPGPSVTNAPIAGLYFPVQVKAAAIFDLELGYDITKWANISVGANNIFNKTPEIPRLLTTADGIAAVPTNGTSPYINGQTGINAPYTFGPYGTKGGYYYARIGLKF